MLKNFEKIENILNRILEFIGSMLVSAWKKVVPASFLRAISRFSQSLSAFKNRVKTLLGSFFKALAKPFMWLSPNKLKSLKALHPKVLLSKVLSPEDGIPLRIKAIVKISQFKEMLLKTPLRNQAENIAQSLVAFIDKVSKIPKTQVAIASSAMLMIFFGTFSVYQSGQDIYMKEWAGRAPASAQEYLYRPEYQKYIKRTLKVFNVKVPVYVESVKAVQSVTVDFAVRTDTRFAKLFLEEYEYKLKDYFFMTTEPMMSTFTLGDEGKRVLKDKIQDELNTFLQEEKVQGKVLEVDILFIVGS